MAAIVSAEMSRFGRIDQNILDIAAESSLPIVRKYRDSIDFMVVANCFSGELAGVSGINDLLRSYLSLDTMPSIRVDNTSASGGAAVIAASSMLDSGRAGCILLCGVEKMTGKPTREITSTITSLLSQRERESGPSLPSLAGLLTDLYLKKYGDATRESIAMVSVKNHHNGAMNPLAHIRKEVSLQEVLESRIIADPLRLYEFCPISDGSSSLLLVPDEIAESYTQRPVYIKGTGFASSTSNLTDRKDLLDLEAVGSAGRQALKEAGIVKPDFAELHDMSSILEVVESEALGFFQRGKGWQALESGSTTIKGELPINASGGLISRGHPIGASGVAQLFEAWQQLTRRAGSRQVQGAATGLTLGMAGFGNSAVSLVLEGTA